MKLIKSLIIEQDGPTTVEYALILALIAGACIATIFAVGGQSGIFWGDNAESLDQALNQ